MKKEEKRKPRLYEIFKEVPAHMVSTGEKIFATHRDIDKIVVQRQIENGGTYAAQAVKGGK